MQTIEWRTKQERDIGDGMPEWLWVVPARVKMNKKNKQINKQQTNYF